MGTIVDKTRLGMLLNHIEELEQAIAYAHGRLEREEACPSPKEMANSLRMLADERAAWIEVAIEHNKQCKQLNPEGK